MAINLKFGFNFEFKRDKSEDMLSKEHERELQKLKWEKESKEVKVKNGK